jgi:hypothetical protein
MFLLIKNSIIYSFLNIIHCRLIWSHIPEDVNLHENLLEYEIPRKWISLYAVSKKRKNKTLPI